MIVGKGLRVRGAKMGLWVRKVERKAYLTWPRDASKVNSNKCDPLRLAGGFQIPVDVHRHIQDPKFLQGIYVPFSERSMMGQFECWTSNVVDFRGVASSWWLIRFIATANIT